MSEKTLLFAGVDLSTLTGITIRDMSGIYAPGLRKGSDIDLGYRQGSIPVPGLQYAAYAFSVFIAVYGDGPADFEANLRAAVGGLLSASSSGLGTLERHLDKVGGGHDTHTAQGRFVSQTSFSQLNPDTGESELQFVNLSGAWSPDGGTTWLVP